MNWKIAVVGLGEATHHIHLPAYNKLSNVEVVGGFDPGVKEAKEAFPLFSSLEEMIDKTRPDILSVVTPTASHFELTRAGLLAGCHVLCEKPFMSSMQEADEIVALSKQVDKRVVVNNQYRFMNIHEAAKHRIGSPDFGELLFMSAHQTFYVSQKTEGGWRGQDVQRTCKEFGIHVLDLSRFYFGEDPVSISARMPKGKHPDGPDYLNLIQLEFSGDRVAHIILDRFSRGPHHYLDIRLDGSEGIVETSVGGNVELCAGIRGGTRKPYLNMDISMGGRAHMFHGEAFSKIASDPLDLFAHATHKLVAAFTDALETGATPPCDCTDNRRTLALVFAAYESQRVNAPITMNYQLD